MIVYLVRHADAIAEQPGLPDAARHLTAAGRAAARHLGDRLRWYDCGPTTAWTSPATRAVQTIELLLGALQWDGLVEVQAALAPGGDVRSLPAKIAACGHDAFVVLCGHEPGISALGALLTGRAEFGGLRKAQIARLDGHQGEPHMTLRWRFGPGDDAPVPAV